MSRLTPVLSSLATAFPSRSELFQVDQTNPHVWRFQTLSITANLDDTFTIEQSEFMGPRMQNWSEQETIGIMTKYIRAQFNNTSTFTYQGLEFTRRMH